jgi:tetratricopeptide (TPR) repeat protein
MSNTNPENPGPTHSLPERANLEHLRKEAKQRLKTMRIDDSGATLAAAQLAVAREYGFTSWRRLVAYVKAQRDKETQLQDQLRAANAFAQVPQSIHDGFEAEVQSDYKTAAAHYRQVIAKSPTFIPAYYRLGRALVRQQLYGEALEAFERLLEVDPENLLAHYEIGKLHLSFRKYSDEVLLKFDLENLLPHYEKLLLLDGIGKIQLSDQRYVDAITNTIPRRQFAPDNLLADHEIGKLYLSARNYADAIAKYRWLKAQTDNPMNHMADPSYELLPSKPRTGDIARHPKHQAYAAELALYLLDLIPPEVAEQHHLPSSQIDFAAPVYIPEGQREVVWGDQPVRQMNQRLQATPLYHEKAKSTEIARINRLFGTVSLRGVIDVVGQITNIHVLRGLPDGLTRRAIHALQQFRFQPATIDGRPVSVLSGKYEFGFWAGSR